MSYKIIWTAKKKTAAIKAITEYLSMYGPGECIGQNDDALIDAPSVMSYIADDILKEDEGIVWLDEKDEEN